MESFQAAFIPGVMLGLALLSAAYLYRVLGLNGILTKVILLLLVIGTANERVEMFVDIALGFALLNLVGSLAIAKYLERQGDAFNAMG